MFNVSSAFEQDSVLVTKGMVDPTTQGGYEGATGDRTERNLLVGKDGCFDLFGTRLKRL